MPNVATANRNLIAIAFSRAPYCLIAVLLTLSIIASIRSAQATFLTATVTPNPVQIFQGFEGAVTITLTNTLNLDNVVIDSITALAATPDSVNPGDTFDTVIRQMIAPFPGSCRVGTVILPAFGFMGSCDMTETFVGFDSRLPDPNMDVGNWNLTVNITDHNQRTGASEGVVAMFAVQVFDPGACQAPSVSDSDAVACVPVPEPSSLALLIPALAAIGLVCYRKRLSSIV